jgi:hypothetical protein
MPDLGLDAAWVVGGGYKYLQLGEGNCFLRLPAHAEDLRPVVTGWYAEFGALADEHDPARVPYGRGAERFAGWTYDPTSHYRAARVFAFFAEQGLTPERLRASTAARSTCSRRASTRSAPTMPSSRATGRWPSSASAGSWRCARRTPAICSARSSSGACSATAAARGCA